MEKTVIVTLALLSLLSLSVCRVYVEEIGKEGENSPRGDLWSVVITSSEHAREIENIIREELNGIILSGRESATYGHLPEEWIVFTIGIRVREGENSKRYGEREGEEERESVRERLRLLSHVSDIQFEENRERTTKGIAPSRPPLSRTRAISERMREGKRANERNIEDEMDSAHTERETETNPSVRERERRDSPLASVFPSDSDYIKRERKREERERGTMSERDAGQSLFSDPLYENQWHLLNKGQEGGREGIDANPMGAWQRDTTGAGVQILIVDDGVQRLHPDLESHFVLESSFSFSDSSHDPTPIPTESHGTSCAGVAAAIASNAVCGVGIAYNASLAGIEILGVTSADVDEAAALTYDLKHNMIYSNSWGPLDTGATLEGPGPRTQSSLERGVSEGRDGKGAIYVWAGGNGLENGDNVNYDGFANRIETIAVGAVNHYGFQSYYSEPGAPLLVTAPSSGLDLGITTIDLTSYAGSDPGDCTASFGGTSSATPLVAGSIALMLQANPQLGWRDVQHILVHTARLLDVNDADWLYNGAGLHVNHKYGFGLIDASAAVELATQWNSFPAQAETVQKSSALSSPIPDGTGEALEFSFHIEEDVGPLEHVQLQVTADHRRASDLEITLFSPHGTPSVLSEDHGYDSIAQLSSSVAVDSGVWALYSSPCPDEGIEGSIVAAVPADGCATLQGNYEGAIVLLRRGTCDFIAKTFHAQDAGALAALVYDNTDDAPFAMGGSDPHVSLPSAMISQNDGNALLTAIANLEGEEFLQGALFNVTSKPLSDPYNGWKFMSVRHWGESSVGEWRVQIFDRFATVAGTMEAIQLTLFGSGTVSEGSEESVSILSSNAEAVQTSKISLQSSEGDDSYSSRDSDEEASAHLWEDLFIVASSLLGLSLCMLLAAVVVAAAGLAAYTYRHRQQVTYDIAYELKEVEESDSSVLLDDAEDADAQLNPLHG